MGKSIGRSVGAIVGLGLGLLLAACSGTKSPPSPGPDGVGGGGGSADGGNGGYIGGIAGAPSPLLTCSPGTRRCDGSNVKSCDDTGSKEIVAQTCLPSQVCSSGACVGRFLG